jgi:hypothetical protein
MTTPRRALLLLALAPAFALGACGGSSDSDDIKDVIQDVAKNSATACDHASKKLLAQLGGDKAKCEAAARAYPDDKPGEVKGDIDVKVNGDTATADFTDNEGKKQHVSFVKEDGEWKIDGSDELGG